MTLEENNTVGSETYRFTCLAKLDNILVGRYLTLQDNIFVENVVSDIQHFLDRGETFHKSVLIFPPVNNYRRFLIHKICEEITCKELSTFSIGQGFSRRTVVCVNSLIRKTFSINQTHDSSLKTFEDITPNKMVVERQPLSSGDSPEHHSENDNVKRVRSAPAIYRPPAARKLEAIQMKQNVDVSPSVQTKPSPSRTEKTRSNTRQRRPDLQVYVPRAKRASLMDQSISESSEHKEISSVYNQVPSEVKKHVTNVPTCVRSPVNACSEKTSYVSSQSSLKSDSESRLVSKRGDVNSAVTKEKHLSSTIVNRSSLGVERDSLKSAVPSYRSDDSFIFNRDSSELSDSCPNNTKCKEFNERESNILCSSTSDTCISNNKDNTDINLKGEDDNEVILNDSANSSNLFLSDEFNKSDQISNENNMYQFFQCDGEQLKKSAPIMEIIDFPSNKDNLVQKNVTGKDKDVECSINKEISRSERSNVSDVLNISDSEIPVQPLSKSKVTKTEQAKIEENSIKGNSISKKPKSSSKTSSPNIEEKSKNLDTPSSAALVSSTTPAVSLNPDECTWDMLFDDNGDCLDPKIMEELTNAVGCVSIEKPQSDYNSFLSKQEINLPGGDDEYAHVVEIYDFPPDFKTQDLLTIFAAYKNGGFEIKWVDDTHALGVFSSSRVAADVLAYNHPLVKTRPLSEATPESRLKARRSAEFLQPYRARPETCVALARRLVTGALGMRISTSREEREAERRLLKEAREKKRLAARQQQDAWEGTIR